MNISYSAFVTNRASDNGGAMFVEERSEVDIFACPFSQNTATVSGGAIQNFQATLIISQNIFENNSASTNGGGAIHVVSTGVLNMTNSICSGNQALEITSDGGAIQSLDDSSIFLQNVIFQNNNAQKTGGALSASYKSIVQIVNCSFTDNEVDVYHGGAIFIEHDSLIIIHDSVFYNNRVQRLGCVFVSQSLAYFKNSIFKNNAVKGPDASSAGGALYLFESQVRFSGGSYSNNIAKRGQELYVEKSSIFTYQVTFHNKNKAFKSTDKDFREITLKENIIYIKDEGTVMQETPYFSSKYVLAVK